MAGALPKICRFGFGQIGTRLRSNSDSASSKHETRFLTRQPMPNICLCSLFFVLCSDFLLLVSCCLLLTKKGTRPIAAPPIVNFQLSIAYARPWARSGGAGAARPAAPRAPTGNALPATEKRGKSLTGEQGAPKARSSGRSSTCARGPS